MTAPPRLSSPKPLGPDHDLSRFACGEPALDHWLCERARRNESRFSRCYVVCDGQRVAGYYAISAASVERAAAPGRMRRNAPDAIPVAVIGRLAVDRAYAGRGLGADLLADALRRVAMASKSIGIAAVMVQAKSEAARRFYLRCAEFVEFPADSRVLFLGIGDVARIIAGRGGTMRGTTDTGSP